MALSGRIKAYNSQLDYVEQLENEGRIYCIRPEHPLQVGRIEKDTSKLETLYEEGYEIGNKFCTKYFNSI